MSAVPPVFFVTRYQNLSLFATGRVKKVQEFNRLLTRSFLKSIWALSSFRRRPESRKNGGLEKPLDSGLRRNDVQKDFFNGLSRVKGKKQRTALVSDCVDNRFFFAVFLLNP
jgi:hypothetical protein